MAQKHQLQLHNLLPKDLFLLAGHNYSLTIVQWFVEGGEPLILQRGW